MLVQLQTSGCEKHQRGRVSRTSVRSPQWPLRLFPDAHPTPPPAFQKGFGVSFPSPYKVIPVSLQGSIEWLDGPLIHWLDMDWEFDRKINPAFDCSALSLTVCMPPKGDTAGCVEGRTERAPQLCLPCPQGAASRSCVLGSRSQFPIRAHSAPWRLERTSRDGRGRKLLLGGGATTSTCTLTRQEVGGPSSQLRWASASHCTTAKQQVMTMQPHPRSCPHLLKFISSICLMTSAFESSN